MIEKALERASDDMLEIVHCEIPLHTFPSLHCSGSGNVRGG